MKAYTKSEDYFFTECSTNKVIDTWSGFSDWFKHYEFVRCALLENALGEQFYLYLTL